MALLAHHLSYPPLAESVIFPRSKKERPVKNYPLICIHSALMGELGGEFISRVTWQRMARGVQKMSLENELIHAALGSWKEDTGLRTVTNFN